MYIELLTDREFGINSNDYFSHDDEDSTKIPEWQFEEDKNILRSKRRTCFSTS